MNRRIFLGSLAAAAVAGIGTTFTSRARAFSLKVTPIPVIITGGGTSTMVEIENSSNEPLRVQANVFDWTQTPAGEDTLVPSGELIVFPSMVIVAPNSTRKVRVGTQGGYGASEKSFRIIFAELPPDAAAISSEEQVRVIAHVSVPIFVKPPGAAGALKVEALSATKDHVRFGVRNTGNAHALISKVHLELLSDTGHVVGNVDAAGWYVLPGLVRPFDVDVSKVCAGATSVRVIAESLDSGAAIGTTSKPPC